MIQRPQFPRINRNAPLQLLLLGGGASTLLAADASGYGNHGTLTNMDPPTDWVWDSYLGRWTTDHITDDYILTPIVNHGIGTGDFSILAWVLTRTIAAGHWAIWANGSYAPELFLHDGGVLTDYFGGFGDSGFSLAINLWYHVAYVRRAGTVYFYLNGVQAPNTYAHWGSMANARWKIGACTDSGGDYWNGQLADVLAYNRALSPAEIAQEANPAWSVMKGGLILPPRRRIFPAAAAPPSFAGRTHIIGGGIAA